MALKKNQPSLCDRVEETFRKLDEMENPKIEVKKLSHFETLEAKHGRQDVRTYRSLPKSAYMKLMPSLEMGLGFKNLNTIIEATSRRIIKGETKIFKRYFISSRKADAATFGNIIRAHWQVENNLHWTLDVTFNEDKSRIRKMNSPENFGTLRKFVFNILKKDPSKKSLRMKRKRASWNPNVMLQILTNPLITLN